MELWNEFSSRLLNHLELSRQRVGSDPGSATRGVARAVEETGRYLGLPYQAEVAPVASPEMAAALKVAIAAYLPLAEALAKDDGDAAARSAAYTYPSITITKPCTLSAIPDRPVTIGN
jgi:hypothetical protein